MLRIVHLSEESFNRTPPPDIDLNGFPLRLWSAVACCHCLRGHRRRRFFLREFRLMATAEQPQPRLSSNSV